MRSLIAVAFALATLACDSPPALPSGGAVRVEQGQVETVTSGRYEVRVRLAAIEVSR